MKEIHVSDKEVIPWQAMGPAVKTVIYFPTRPPSHTPVKTVIISWQTSGASDEKA